MAIFGNDEQTSQETETIIGSSVKVDGNFKGEGNITVEGVVQGSLKTNHDLTVGPQAKIKAEVEANNLYLSGEVRGNIKVTEKTKLTSSAKVFGNIETKSLSVEEGAIINGKCMMVKEDPQAEQQKKNGRQEKGKSS